MTRVEMMNTLSRLGYETHGLADGRIKVEGYEPMNETAVFEFLSLHAETHCLSCGRPYDQTHRVPSVFPE